MAAEQLKSMEQQETRTQTAHAGKYLTFKLSSEDYGLEVLKVQEIIGVIPATRIPKMPSFVRGIINLRGKLIPVIDIRKKFGMADQQDSEKTCIIIVQLMAKQQRLTLGVVVDSVSEVLNIQEEQIEPPPTIGAALDTEFIAGVSKVGNKVVILLDIDSVLTRDETHQVLETVNNNNTNKN